MISLRSMHENRPSNSGVSDEEKSVTRQIEHRTPMRFGRAGQLQRSTSM